MAEAAETPELLVEPKFKEMHAEILLQVRTFFACFMKIPLNGRNLMISLLFNGLAA
jgi:hypothetical protein